MYCPNVNSFWQSAYLTGNSPWSAKSTSRESSPMRQMTPDWPLLVSVITSPTWKYHSEILGKLRMCRCTWGCRDRAKRVARLSGISWALQICKKENCLVRRSCSYVEPRERYRECSFSTVLTAAGSNSLGIDLGLNRCRRYVLPLGSNIGTKSSLHPQGYNLLTIPISPFNGPWQTLTQIPGTKAGVNVLNRVREISWGEMAWSSTCWLRHTTPGIPTSQLFKSADMSASSHTCFSISGIMKAALTPCPGRAHRPMCMTTKSSQPGFKTNQGWSKKVNVLTHEAW